MKIAKGDNGFMDEEMINMILVIIISIKTALILIQDSITTLNQMILSPMAISVQVDKSLYIREISLRNNRSKWFPFARFFLPL